MGFTKRRYKKRKAKHVNKDNKSVQEKARWVCLTVRERYKKPIEFPNAIQAIRVLLSSDCIHLLYIGEKLCDGVYESGMDGYIFLKCNNLFDHLKDLKESRFVDNILSGYDNIQYIDEREIKDLVADWKRIKSGKKTCNKIMYGDTVTVKSGKYSGLSGIVVDSKKQCYEVAFKFNFGCVTDKILFENIVRKNNFLDMVKHPV